MQSTKVQFNLLTILMNISLITLRRTSGFDSIINRLLTIVEVRFTYK